MNAVTTALQIANGLVLIGLQAGSGGVYDETLYSSSMACPDCGINVPKLEPRSFSFNSNYGACPECHGLGSHLRLSTPPRPSPTGPSRCSTARWGRARRRNTCCGSSSSQRKIQDQPQTAVRRELSKEHQDLLLYGPPARRRWPHRLSTASSATCATTSKRRNPKATAST